MCPSGVLSGQLLSCFRTRSCTKGFNVVKLSYLARGTELWGPVFGLEDLRGKGGGM